MSEGSGTIECMFEDLESLDDDAVLAAVEDAARAEAAAAARGLAAVAELTRRRCAEDGDDHRAWWACDSWDAAAAELSAALNISRGRVSGQMYLAVSVFRRLPRVAELFAQGRLSARVVAVIADRTDLVRDADALTAVDEAVADRAEHWGPLSAYKLEQAVDAVVDRLDPAALRRTRAAARSRDVQIGGRRDPSGTATLWGRLFAADATVLDRRLTAMAREVCEADPRTIAQRRADALGALAAGAQSLACRCGSEQCAGVAAQQSATVVIHVLAEAEALSGGPDPQLAGPEPAVTPFSHTTGLTAFLRQPEPPEPEPTCPQTGGVIVGGGFLPGPMLADLVAGGAEVRPVARPSDAPEPGHRPSRALAEFVRTRDVTCRFPGCEVAAQFCDIDHAIPWPHGPTHASNLRLMCRKDHLLKTFWTGPAGWSDRQFPDGSIEWTSPTGRVYTTVPGSRLLFPDWDTTTAAVCIPGVTAAPADHRGLQMPRRRRTRRAEQADRIRRERALNDARVAERAEPSTF